MKSFRNSSKKTYLVLFIGTIHSTFKRIEDSPIQMAKSFKSKTIVLKELFLPAIKIYTPEIHGTFATHNPHHSNLIGLTVVKLLSIDGHLFLVRVADYFDGTQVIGIKPHNPDIDVLSPTVVGWCDNSKMREKKKSIVLF